MQDLSTPDRNGILVKIEEKQFLVPSKAIGQCNTISYSGLLNKYNETVIQDTKQTKGPLFRHFFKSSKRFTRIPMGIAVMKKKLMFMKYTYESLIPFCKEKKQPM